MPILSNDPYGGGQELINQGQSKIPLRETYSVDPRSLQNQYSDQMRNVNSLVDSLSTLSKGANAWEERQKQDAIKNGELYAADVAGKLNSNDPVETQLARIRPDLNTWARAATAQAIARNNATTAAQQAYDSMPLDVRGDPVKAQAYFDAKITEHAGKFSPEDRAFYAPTFVDTMRKHFQQNSASLATERGKVINDTLRADGRTQSYEALQGAIKNGSVSFDPAKAPNPDDAAAIGDVSKRFNLSPLETAMVVNSLPPEAVPEGGTPKTMLERLPEIERQLLAKGLTPGMRFADMYKLLNPKATDDDIAKAKKSSLLPAATMLGLPTDPSYTMVRGRPVNVSGDIRDSTSLVDPATAQKWAGQGTMAKAEGFVVHHTGGDGTVEGVVSTLKSRGLSVQYVIDREGAIHKIMPDGAVGYHTKPGADFAGSKAPHLNNSNTIGVEIIAKDDKDVRPEQVAAARKLIAAEAGKHGFSKDAVFGHGEVNPGHKQSDEGMSTVSIIRDKGFDTSDLKAAAAPAAVGSSPFKSDIFARALKLGMPEHLAQLAAAQASLESGDGTSHLAKSAYNLFGIKANSQWGGKTVNVGTKEEENGTLVPKQSAFRAYANADESLADWWKTIQSNYPNTANSSNLKEAIAGLKTGKNGAYATDTQYGAKVEGRAQGIELTNPNAPENTLLSPEAYMARLAWMQSDSMLGKTNPTYSNIMRKTDSLANLKQLAYTSLNPDLLKAFPDHLLNPDQRKDLEDWGLHIVKQKQALATAAFTEHERQQKIAREQSHIAVNQFLLQLKPGEAIDENKRTEIMMQLNRVDPKLAEEFPGMVEKVHGGRLDGKIENEKWMATEKLMHDVLENGGDPTTVPLNTIYDPALRTKAFEYGKQLLANKGEISGSYYSQRYQDAVEPIFGKVSASSTRSVNNPVASLAMRTEFMRQLNDEIGSFRTKNPNVNITNDYQRQQIFENAFNRTALAYRNIMPEGMIDKLGLTDRAKAMGPAPKSQVEMSAETRAVKDTADRLFPSK